jgi:hypothetical protein
MWVTVQYVLLLSHCLLRTCLTSFAPCHVLISCFIFLIYSFYVCFLFVCVLLLIFCVLCFCIVSCIVYPQAYSRLFSIYVLIYRPHPPGGNQTGVNIYHITSYQHVLSITFCCTADSIPVIWEVKQC